MIFTLWLPFAMIFIDVLSLTVARANDNPDIMLAEIYRQGIDVNQYWVSEKLDGVRARWDGSQLVSRGGNVFAAPEWFIKGFPSIALDGELWTERGRYEEVASIVRKQYPHEGWRTIRLMVFDLPKHGGTFDERVMVMKRLKGQFDSPFLVIIEQQAVESEEALERLLQSVVDRGGEGLMLHRKTALYASGRSQDLLKLKLFSDAEATVIGYRPGKGKYTGQVGSLHVRTDEGVVFYVGTGLSDAQRQHPPPLQSRITFRHQGFTKNGIPRFPVYLRVRDEEPQEVYP